MKRKHEDISIGHEKNEEPALKQRRIVGKSNKKMMKTQDMNFKINDVFPYRHVHSEPIFWDSLNHLLMSKDLKNNDVVISKEVKGKNRKFMLFSIYNVEKFADHCESQANLGKLLYYHETILHSRNTKFYADFDYSIRNPANKDEIIEKCMESVIFFCEYIKEEIQPRKFDYFIEDASTEKKFSIHIKSNDLLFGNSTQLAIFIYQILGKMVYGVLDTKRKLLIEILDTAVYHKNHNLRTYYSVKIGDKNRRFNQFDKANNKIIPEFDRKFLINSLITFNTGKALFFQDVVNFRHSKRYLEYISIASKSGYIKATPPSKYASGKDKIIVKRLIDSGIQNQVAELISKEWEDSDLKCKGISIGVNERGENVWVSFELMGNFCPLDKKNFKHKTRSGRQLIYCYLNGNSKITCRFNPKCKGNKVMCIKYKKEINDICIGIK